MTASGPLGAAAPAPPRDIRSAIASGGSAIKLFLDLDGVLADFDRGVHEVTGRCPEELPLKAMWAALSRAPRFCETLAFTHDAEALWRFCEPHRPTILTGLPLGAWVPEQKKRWVARMLGAHVPIITELGQSRPDFGSGCHVSR